MTDIRCSSGSERPLGWNDPDLPPPVKRGNQSEYVLAVYRESSKKIYSFACSYLNALPLQYEDACPKGTGCEGRGCDDGCPTTGWFWLTGEGDEAGTYQSLDMKPGDRIMGWRDLPQWGGVAQASGEPVAWRITDGEGGYNISDAGPTPEDIAWAARYGRKHEPLYAVTPSPGPGEWQPIETAPGRIREFAKLRQNTIPRGPVVQLGGSLEDGSLYLFGHHALTHEVQQWIVIPALYCRPMDALSVSSQEQTTPAAPDVSTRAQQPRG